MNYDSVDDKAELEEFAKAIEGEVNVTHLTDVNRVISEVVKEPVKHLKNNKSDTIDSFSSDTMRHSPDILFENLVAGIRSQDEPS